MPRTYDTTEISNKWARAMLPGGRDPEAEAADDYVNQRLGRSARRAIPPDQLEQLIMALVMSELQAQQRERFARIDADSPAEQRRAAREEREWAMREKEFSLQQRRADLDFRAAEAVLADQLSARERQADDRANPQRKAIEQAKDQQRQARFTRGQLGAEELATHTADRSTFDPDAARFAAEQQTQYLTQQGGKEYMDQLETHLAGLEDGFDMSKESPRLFSLIDRVDAEFPEADPDVRATIKAAMKRKLTTAFGSGTLRPGRAGDPERDIPETPAIPISRPRNAQNQQLYPVNRQGFFEEPIDPANPPIGAARRRLPELGGQQYEWGEAEDVARRNRERAHALAYAAQAPAHEEIADQAGADWRSQFSEFDNPNLSPEERAELRERARGWRRSRR